MSLALLVTNLLQATAGLLWAAGVRRFSRPVAPALWADLLKLALVLPVVVPAVGVLGLLPPPPDGWALLRVDRWAQTLFTASNPLRLVLSVLLAGTAVIFVVQELLPVLGRRRSIWALAQRRDPRLDSSLARVRKGFAAQGMHRLRGRPPQARRLETLDPVAALYGFVRPTLLISRGLLEQLDDDQLDVVVAHELAHLIQGGNLGRLVVWVLRALQAPNPATLVLFRSFIEAQEAACDSIAARVTGRPATLAEVLLQLERGRGGPATVEANALRRARSEVLRRSDQAATRVRVRALLDQAPAGATPRLAYWGAAAALVLLLWGIQ